MICWVVERTRAARNVARTIVATDDERICNAVQSAGYEVVMTSGDHRSGTDRVAEVAANLDDADIIVNVQGDEPLISPDTIEGAVTAMEQSWNWGKAERNLAEEYIGIVTSWEPIECAADVLNPDVVKVLVNENERAIYFSRLPVPYPREAVLKYGSIEAALSREPGLLTNFRKHTGLYVYRREVLLEFAKWPHSTLERLESLEQLRALEHGVWIKAIRAGTPSIGVDTLEDLERVRHLVASQEAGVSSSLA